MSISNFKDTVITRTLAILIVIIVLFEASIVIFRPKTPDPVSYDQYNLSKGQRFLYDPSGNATILTGSSMSLCFDASSPAENIKNLSFVGLSSLTGLELAKRSGVNPQFVIIEVNFIDRPVDTKFIHSLFQPALRTLRKYLHVMRSEWQPVNVLIAYIGDFIKSRSTGLPTMDAEPAISKDLLRVNLEAYHNGKGDFAKTTNILKHYIQHFEQRGTTVILLEMPMHSLIHNDEKANGFRNALLNEFPTATYHWILSGAAADNETSDGLHLNKAGVKRYIPLFYQKVRAITAQHASFQQSRPALE